MARKVLPSSSKKKNNNKKPLPKLARAEHRRIIMDLMLGLDHLFCKTLIYTGYNAREILEIRPIYQTVMRNHLNGQRSTAQRVAKAIGVSRGTVRRCLDALVKIGWLDHHRSQYWISVATARMPTMPRSAYLQAFKLLEQAHKRWRALRKK